MLSLKHKVQLQQAKIKTKKVSFILFLWILGVITGVTYLYAYNSFKAILEPRTIVIEVAKADFEPQGESNTPAIEEKVPNPDVESILDTIYSKESSRGKNDQKCEREGGHNGYGYGQGVGRNLCFESDDETRETVRIWVEKRLSEGLDEKTLLCYYNTGVKTNNCSYTQ